MKQLTVVVKPFRVESVLGVIAAAEGIAECVVREAKGYSRQKGYLERYIGSEYSSAFLPKVEITVWVEDHRAESLANRIAQTARTGRIGDGKVFTVASAPTGTNDNGRPGDLHVVSDVPPDVAAVDDVYEF